MQTRVVRMVTKVKGRPYFFLSSDFGCLFARHFFSIALDKEVGTTVDVPVPVPTETHLQ